MNHRILMFGWEFPPFKSGGLGTACHDLAKGLTKFGTKITFVMPTAPKGIAKFVKIVGANTIPGVRVKKIKSLLSAYITSEQYEEHYHHLPHTISEVYGKNLIEEVNRYSAGAKRIAKQEKHDIIHVHDWMTYEAGINARKTSKKPLVAHIHATEFDRTGGNPNPHISHIEYLGLKAADTIIANSNYTKQNVIDAYNIPPEKIKVVHWGIDDVEQGTYTSPLRKDNHLVLFLGRVTLQKGPDYFIETARKVLEHEPNTTFVVVGDGDMLPHIMNRSAELGISDNIIFTGRLAGTQVYDAFKAADLYVMPSVSEPFGLVALESLKNETPILISKQSGVSEVLQHALKADFWDIDDMTNQIVSVLRHPPLKQELTQNGTREVQRHTIYEPAKKVLDIYRDLCEVHT